MKGVSAEIQKRIFRLADKVMAAISEIHIKIFRNEKEKQDVIAVFGDENPLKNVTLILINCEEYDGKHPA